MASSSASGASSGSYFVQTSASEEDLQHMDQRKRKRMLSNREASRRSRLRKQRHLDDLRTQLDKKQKEVDYLMTQLAQLKKESNQITTSISQHYHNIMAENSILRAQVAELSHRLQFLNPENSKKTINFLNASSGGFGSEES